MTLAAADIALLADRLCEAQDAAAPIAQISDDYPGMSADDGYAVQHALTQRWTDRGARIIGYKAGLTSQVKMKQIGIDVPSFGVLTSAMALPENGDVPTGELIHPRVEAELAFVMKDELQGTDLSIDAILAATDFVIPAIEIIDSRYQNFKFDLASVVADNSSGARYATGGRPMAVDAVDLRTIGVVVERNGEIVAVGASAAVLNHPARAVSLLVGHLSRYGRSLPAGSYVMTGSITEAIPVAAGDSVCARFQNMGSITLRCV